MSQLLSTRGDAPPVKASRFSTSAWPTRSVFQPPGRLPPLAGWAGTAAVALIALWGCGRSPTDGTSGGAGTLQEEFAVVDSFPAPGARDVALDASIEVVFSVDPSLATVDAASFRVEGAEGALLEGAYRRGTSSRRVVFDPQRTFSPGEEIVVTLTEAIRTPSGRGLVPHAFRFRTRGLIVDDSPPPGETQELILESAYPAPGERDVAPDVRIELLWNEALDPESVTPPSAWLLGEARGRIPALVALDPDPRRLTVQPLDPLYDGERVRVHLSSSIRGANGAPFGGAVLSFRVRSAPLAGDVRLHRVYKALGNVRLLETGDLNGDGTTDVAYAAERGTFVDLLLGSPEGELQLGVRIDVGQEVLCFALADVEADGDLDVVVGTRDRVRLYRNRLVETAADGLRLEAPADFPAGAPVRSLAIGDLDHAGLPDLVLDTDGGLRICLGGMGAPDWETQGSLRVSRTQVVLADVNLDGWLDIVYGDAAGKHVVLCLAAWPEGSRESVSWVSDPVRIELGVAASRVQVEDIGGDSLPDIVAVTEGAAPVPGQAGFGPLRLLQQTGGGVFFEASLSGGADPGLFGLDPGLALADLDGDGLSDFLLASQPENRVVWYPNDNGALALSEPGRLLLSAPSPRWVGTARLGAAGGGADIVAAGGDEIHVLAWAAVAPEPPDGAFQIAVEGTQARRNDVGASLFLRLNNPEPVGGYSVALGYDPSAIQPTGVSLEGTVTGAAEPEFEVYNPLVSGDGVVYTVILELVEPFEGKAIPAGENQLLFRLLFDVPATAPLGPTEIGFLEEEGPPPILTELIVDAVGVVPLLQGGTVEILQEEVEPPPPSGNLLKLSRTTADPGGEAVLDVLAGSLEPIEGYTIVVAYDPAVVEVTDFDLTGTETEQKAPEQILPRIANAEGYSMLTVILDFLPPLDGRAIPAGEDLLLARVKFRVRSDAPPGAIEVALENGKGAPPLDNIFVVGGGLRVEPSLSSGEIQIAGSQEPEFLRGNVDDDPDINLADALFVANYLFLSGEEPVCLDAADTDDNGEIDLTDPVYLLNHLFLSGPEPPPPYPEAGVDPTPDDLGC